MNNKHSSANSISYWSSTSVDAPYCETLKDKVSADVVVIGGGFSGLSTALHLRERGIETTVIEASELCTEASARSCGLVIPALKKEDPELISARYGEHHGQKMITMMRDSADYTFDLIKKYNINCDAEQTGWIQPAHSNYHAKKALKLVKHWQRYDADVEYLDRDQVRTKLGGDFYKAAWKANSGGTLHPKSYAHGLANTVIALGGNIFTNSPVISIEKHDSGWFVKTSEGEVSAKKIVIATNATTQKNLWKNLSKSIIPASFYQLVSQPLSEQERSVILPGREAMSDMQNDLHFARFDRYNRLITGGALITERNWRVKLEKIAKSRMEKLFPDLPSLELTNHWSGSVGMTMDFFPKLLSLAPGVFCWMGCNGRGVSLTTNMGRVMADVIEEKPESSLPLPIEELKGIPFNQILTTVSLYSLIYYRAEDYGYRKFS